MSGIVGVWNLDGKPVDDRLLPGLMEPLSHRGPDGTAWWSAASVALGSAESKVAPESSEETQPLVAGDRCVLVWDGRLDNRSELIASLEERAPSVTRDAPDTALVLAAYELWSERFAEKLLGDFALAIFDRARHQLLLGRDAIGVRPLYWVRAGDTVVFSSQIRSILAHPRVSARPNLDLLAEYFLMGPPKANSASATFFRDIHTVAPGHVVRFSEDERVARSRRYFDFEGISPLRLPSPGDYAEGFRHHFRRSVARRLRSAHPVAVSISGGLDSSSILCTALDLARHDSDAPPIVGVTLAGEPGTPHDETVFVEAIERMYGIEIARVPATVPRAFSAMKDEAAFCEGPQLTVQWHNSSGVFAQERAMGARVALTGICGDEVVFERAYLVDLLDRMHWGTVWRHLHEYPRWDARDQRWFNKEFLRFVATEHVPTGLVPPFRRLRGMSGRPTPHLPFWSPGFKRRAIHGQQAPMRPRRDFGSVNGRAIYRTIRSLYWNGIYERDNQEAAVHGLDLAHPILDRDLLSFLMSVPGRFLSFQGVPRSIMREAMRPVLPPEITDRRTKAPFGHSFGAAFTTEIDDVRSYLAGHLASAGAGLIDEDRARLSIPDLLEGAAKEEVAPGRALADLLKAEIWLSEHAGGEGV